MISSPPSIARRSFRSHWWLLGVMWVLFALQTAMDLHTHRARLESEATQHLTSHSRVLADELERRLRSIDATLQALRTTAPLLLAKPDGAAQLRREIQTLLSAVEGIRTLTVIDARGTIVVANWTEVVGKNFVNRSYFQEFLNHPQPDRLHLSIPFTTVLGVYTVILARPIYRRGEFAGLVTATIDVDNLQKLLLSLHATPDTRLFVVHGIGLVLRLFPDALGVKPGTRVDKPGSFFRRHIESGQQESLMRGISATLGTEGYMAMRTVQPPELSMDMPFIVGAARDRSNILDTWHGQVRERLAILVLVILVTGLTLRAYQLRQHHFERKIEDKERERQRSLLALQRFIDHLPGTAYVKDAGLRTVMASKGFLIMLGMDPQALLGKTSAELFPGPFGEKILADDRRILDSGLTEVIEESFNGRDYESTKFVIDAGTGERWLGGMTIDITARKETERQVKQHLERLQALNEKLEAAQNQLLQSEKMASIGQLAAGVAHELNNPIGFVYSNLGTLERYLNDIFEIASVCEQAASRAGNTADFASIEAIKRQKDFDFIRTDVFQLMTESKDGIERVRKIVQDLKDFSHPSETEWQWADLHAGIDSTINIVWNELKYKCTLTRDYGELPKIYCLPAQLNQVFLNLLVNAAHAIPEKGEIVITTGSRNGQVFVAIRDTGQGIAPENLKRIFEPFFTTKPVGKGTGLGLSLVWSIVEKHHGHIDVQSEVGKGTTFTVWLPVEPVDPVEA